MQTIEELDLPHLAVNQPEFAANPYAYIRRAKTQHPWLARSDIGFMIHDLRAIRDLLGRDDLFRPAYDGLVEAMDAKGTPWGRFTDEQMIAMPPQKHQQLRSIFASMFTPRFANQLRPMIKERVKLLLDEWVPKGAFDFEEFASNFPISNMFAMIGLPVDDVKLIRNNLETLGLALALDKSKLPQIDQAILDVEGFIKRAIAARRVDPDAAEKEDILKILIETADLGTVSERELIDLLIFFFIAGYDTSKNVLTYTMWTLLDEPEIYERCAHDLDYCRKVVDEALRYFNPGSIARFAAQDITYRDVVIPKDSMIFFALNTAGRDIDAFSDPDRFNPDRELGPDQRHVAFGLGKHICLGQHIARAQLQEAIHQIAQRIRNPRLTGDVAWRPFPGTWGMRGLPIEFDPQDTPQEKGN